MCFRTINFSTNKSWRKRRIIRIEFSKRWIAWPDPDNFQMLWNTRGARNRSLCGVRTTIWACLVIRKSNKLLCKFLFYLLSYHMGSLSYIGVSFPSTFYSCKFNSLYIINWNKAFSSLLYKHLFWKFCIFSMFSFSKMRKKIF